MKKGRDFVAKCLCEVVGDELCEFVVRLLWEVAAIAFFEVAGGMFWTLRHERSSTPGCPPAPAACFGFELRAY